MRRNRFVTADLHLNHENIIKYCGRPFKNVEEMNEKIIKNWNFQVKPNDIVYILGDFIWNTTPKKEFREIMARLNGEKHLIIGNHDKLTVQQAINLGFKSACYEMILKIASKLVRLSHYPYQPTFFKDLKISLWNKIRFGIWDSLKHSQKRPKNDGKWLIHGHTHQLDFVRGKTINVGMDAHNFKLVSMGKIVNEIKGKK